MLASTADVLRGTLTHYQTHRARESTILCSSSPLLFHISIYIDFISNKVNGFAFLLKRKNEKQERRYRDIYC